MDGIAFDEENTVLDAPPGVPNCAPLPVWVGPTSDGTPVIISCWKLSKEELEEIKQTGRVWLTIFGQQMPPAHLGGISPFKPQNDPPHGEET